MVMPYRPSAPTYGSPSALPSAAASAPSTGYKPPTSVPSMAPTSSGTPWISPSMPSTAMPSKTFDATGGYSNPTRQTPMLPDMAQSAGGSQLTSGMGMNEQTGQQYGQQPTTNMGMQMPYGQPPKAFGSNGYTMPSTGGGQFGLPGAAGTPTPMANPYAQTTGGYQGMPSTGGGQFGLPSAGGAPAQYGGSGAIASGGYGPTGGGQFGLPGAGGTPLDYPPPVTQPPIGSVQAGGNPYPGQQQQAPVADWQAQYGQLSNQQAQQMSEQANNARNLAAIGQYRNITAGDNGTYYGTDYYGQRQQLTGNQAMTSGSASANDLYQQQLNYADQTRRMGQMLRQSQSRYLGGYDPNMLRGNLAGYG